MLKTQKTKVKEVFVRIKSAVFFQKLINALVESEVIATKSDPILFRLEPVFAEKININSKFSTEFRRILTGFFTSIEGSSILKTKTKSK